MGRRRIQVVRYRSQRGMEADMNRHLRQGYEIVGSPSLDRPPSGCLRYILTGGLALFWRPKPMWVVTYQQRDSK